MDQIKLFFKGILIGIGKILPGVSGSMLAISLGIYEKIMYSISNIFIDFKKSVMYLTNVGLGMMFSIILISKLISFFLNNYYFSTMLLFIGLILGGLVSIIKIAKDEANFKNVILLLIPFVIFLIIDKMIQNINLNLELNYLSSFFLGILEAITMIIPGISGTAIMMMLGVYDEILNMFSDFSYSLYLSIYIIGIATSAFCVSKFINKLLNSYRISCYYLIIGFTISSMIILLKQVLAVDFLFSNLAIGIVLMFFGFFISYKLE